MATSSGRNRGTHSALSVSVGCFHAHVGCFHAHNSYMHIYMYTSITNILTHNWIYTYTSSISDNITYINVQYTHPYIPLAWRTSFQTICKLEEFKFLQQGIFVFNKTHQWPRALQVYLCDLRNLFVYFYVTNLSSFGSHSYTHVWRVYVCICMYIYVYTGTYNVSKCTHTHTHTHIHTDTDTDTDTDTHTFVYIIYIHIYTSYVYK